MGSDRGQTPISLLIQLRHAFGRVLIDVRLELGPGLTALVGPSGSGKTTILNVVAGVMQPDACLVRLDNDVLADTASGLWIPAHRRQIGYVFQEPRLFSHLTVRQNLMYGRWFQRRRTGGLDAADVIDQLNLGPFLHRRPGRLSGGEKQRVALGRALLSRPRLLLLDEPLASIDQTHRESILPYLDRIRAEHDVTAMYVTHTWAEVAGRADQVVELDEGRVTFVGAVDEARQKAQGRRQK
jgi:molybdate transport system ATP-binding protein